MNRKFVLGLALIFFLLTTNNLFGKSAIILSSFGTTEPDAISSIMNIKSSIEKTFPETRVELVFTSNIIRSIWQKRSQNPDDWKAKGIASEVIYVKGILETFGKLQSAGFKEIVVQPTHLFHMEQYSDLVSYVQGVASIKTIRKKWMPFDKIAIGRPAMGTTGVAYPYHEDLKRVVKIFKSDIKEAKTKNCLLVYMGHGNEVWSAGIYAELQKEMRQAYPDVVSFVGCVEGFPSIGDIKAGLLHMNTESKKILLKPLMIVAGDHAKNDMAGDEDDSWKRNFEKAGYDVYPVLKGLGSNNEFVQIFIDHINDAAKDADISLK